MYSIAIWCSKRPSSRKGGKLCVKAMPCRWADEEGQDFIINNNVRVSESHVDKHSYSRMNLRTSDQHFCLSQEIDFATIHSWADNWLDDTTGFQTRWIQQHDQDAKQILRKPVSISQTPAAKELQK